MTETNRNMDNAGNQKKEDQPDSVRSQSGNQSKGSRPDQGRAGAPKDVDAQRHPEEQVNKNDFKKDDRSFSDKSGRA
ncbi:MAG: hypothetical protein U1E10_18485 [Bdellovibrionales bacterium]|nr:hypothetical protein [Bdellovibrionales bacterium]